MVFYGKMKQYLWPHFLWKPTYYLLIFLCLLTGGLVLTYFNSAIRIVLAILTPLLIGFFIAYLLHPLALKFSRSTGIKYLWSSVLVFLCFLLIFIVVALLFIPVVIIEVTTFIESFPDISEQFRIIIINIFEDEQIQHYIQNYLLADEELIEFLSAENISDFLEQTFEFGHNILSYVGVISISVFGIFTSIFLGLFLGFYLLKDMEAVRKALFVLVPYKYEQRFLGIIKKIDHSLYNFLTTRLFICSLVGVLVAIGLTILNIPHAILIGLLAGITNIIPYLGPVVGAIPAVILAIIMGYPSIEAILTQTIPVILLFSLVQFFDAFIISPKLIGDRAHLHPILVILALVIGGQYGIGGILLSIPTAIILKVLFVELYFQPAKMKKENLKLQTESQKQDDSQ